MKAIVLLFVIVLECISWVAASLAASRLAQGTDITDHLVTVPIGVAALVYFVKDATKSTMTALSAIAKGLCK